jgi:peptide/nickel transport system permease protein
VHFYIFRRFCAAIFSLLAVSLLSFALSKCTPTSPVDILLAQRGTQDAVSDIDPQEYASAARSLGLDLPAFYFHVQPACYPDTMYRVFPPARREAFELWMDQTGSAEVAKQWLDARQAFLFDTSGIDRVQVAHIQSFIQLIWQQSTIAGLKNIQAETKKGGVTPGLETTLAQLDTQISALTQAEKKSSFRAFLPRWTWHGTQNQYHQWLKQVVTFRFGTSYKYQLGVGTILGIRLKRSITIGLLSVTLALLVAIPAGVMAAGRSKKPITESRTIKFSLFLYAIPVFWMGSILILCFATPFMGIKIFTYDCGTTSSPNVWSWLSESYKCLILPILCMAIHLSAVLFLQMYTSMHDVLQTDYIRTARLKGMSNRQVLWRHAFPNAVFPMITTLGGIIAYIVSGSVVIEYLFNIKGMGSELIEAFQYRDYPILLAIMIIYATAIILGNLLADMAYVWLDPRVRF